MSAKEHIETEKRAADLMLAIDLEEEEKEEVGRGEDEDDTKSELTEDVRSHIALTEKTDYTVKMNYTSKLRGIDSDDDGGEEDEDEEDDDMREFTEGIMDITLEDEEEDEDNELGDRGMTFLPHFQSTGQWLPVWMPSTPLAIAPTTHRIDQGGGEEGYRLGGRESWMAYRGPRSARVDSAKGKYGPGTCTAPLEDSPFSILIF